MQDNACWQALEGRRKKKNNLKSSNKKKKKKDYFALHRLRTSAKIMVFINTDQKFKLIIAVWEITHWSELLGSGGGILLNFLYGGRFAPGSQYAEGSHTPDAESTSVTTMGKFLYIQFSQCLWGKYAELHKAIEI